MWPVQGWKLGLLAWEYGGGSGIATNKKKIEGERRDVHNPGTGTTLWCRLAMRSARATLRRGSEEGGSLKEQYGRRRIGVIVSWDNSYYLVRMEQQPADKKKKKKKKKTP